MALYWVAQGATRVASAASTQAQYTWAAAFTAEAWAVAGMAAWWNRDDDPRLPDDFWLTSDWQACTGDGSKGSEY